MKKIKEILKNSNYDDAQFSEEELNQFEDKIYYKDEVPYVQCIIREKEIKLTPEETIRQLYLNKLINIYGYPKDRMTLEYPIHFGREVKRADIVISDINDPLVPYIIVELKKPKLTDGKEQLKSYCNATGAPIGVWTNGEQISYYNRKDPNYFEDITNIPKITENLLDIINEQITYNDLKKIVNYKLKKIT